MGYVGSLPAMGISLDEDLSEVPWPSQEGAPCPDDDLYSLRVDLEVSSD